MKDIRFDERGNLFPYELISLSLAEFKALFVEAFEKDSTRYEIFERYLQFIDDFSQQISSEFTHWINGSFVSDKFNPNDIDFVTIIPIEIYEQNQTVIEKQFSLWNVKKGYGDRIDAYMVKSYPNNHKFYDAYQCDLLYWQSWFSSTRLNRAKKKFPKGFIQIQFT